MFLTVPIGPDVVVSPCGRVRLLEAYMLYVWCDMELLLYVDLLVIIFCVICYICHHLQVFNLHRRYGSIRLPLLLDGWDVESRVGKKKKKECASCIVTDCIYEYTTYIIYKPH
jgi:hypothetical protein